VASVSLIIPAFDEAQRLPVFLRSVAKYAREHPNDIAEVLVIDDGSSDGTAEQTQELMSELPALRLLRHENNQGKGAAVRTGVMAASAEFVVFIDADGATAISELPKMIASLDKADIGVGNRWMPGAKTQRSSTLRRLSGFVYRTYMGFFGLGSIDTMCGFKGYRRPVAIDLFTDLQEKRWLFDTEIAYKAVRRNYQIVNFPIAWQSMDGSKLDTFTLLKTAFKIWPLIRSLSA